MVIDSPLVSRVELAVSPAPKFEPVLDEFPEGVESLFSVNDLPAFPLLFEGSAVESQAPYGAVVKDCLDELLFLFECPD